MIASISLYLISFIIIWIGSGLIVTSVDHLSRKIKASSFAVSFFVLGLITSVPEIGVGLAAISSRRPEIFIGNLLGGVILIFFLIIPLLAIFGRGIKLSHQLQNSNLLFCFITILAPAYFVMDKKVMPWEAVIIVFLYLSLFVFIQKQKGFLDGGSGVFNLKRYSLWDLIKVLLGVISIFGASRLIVAQTLFLAEWLKVSPFIIGLLILPVGTNLPELFIGIRSITLGKKDVAFGDYIGSATANAFLFGLLSLISPDGVATESNFLYMFFIILGGSFLFYYFARSGYHLSRREGSLLLLVYLAFLLFEIAI